MAIVTITNGRVDLNQLNIGIPGKVTMVSSNKLGYCDAVVIDTSVYTWIEVDAVVACNGWVKEIILYYQKELTYPKPACHDRPSVRIPVGHHDAHYSMYDGDAEEFDEAFTLRDVVFKVCDDGNFDNHGKSHRTLVLDHKTLMNIEDYALKHYPPRDIWNNIIIEEKEYDPWL